MAALTEAKLAEIIQRLVEALHPQQVMLFGSYAWGKPTEDSDADLLVIVDHADEPGYRLAQRAYRSLYGVGFPCDVLVHTREEVEQARQVKASLLNQITENGRIVYG